VQVPYVIERDALYLLSQPRYTPQRQCSNNSQLHRLPVIASSRAAIPHHSPPRIQTLPKQASSPHAIPRDYIECNRPTQRPRPLPPRAAGQRQEKPCSQHDYWVRPTHCTPSCPVWGRRGEWRLAEIRHACGGLLVEGAAGRIDLLGQDWRDMLDLAWRGGNAVSRYECGWRVIRHAGCEWLDVCVVRPWALCRGVHIVNISRAEQDLRSRPLQSAYTCGANSDHTYRKQSGSCKMPE